MSGQEIERKFLVRKGSDWKVAACSVSHIVQGYIKADGATVRIRLRDDKAYLTIKGPSLDGGLSRYEFEQQIPELDAREMLKLCKGGVIDKHRYLIKSGSHVFEVDEFHGLNDGLVMAEVELSSADEPYERLEFLGPEVTGDHHFYNKQMLANPYCEWKALVPEEYR